jgi:signal transduction histidine kinase
MMGDLSTLVSQVPGVEVSLTMTGAWEDLPRAVSLNAYRIVQEALTNVVKHAGPTRAEVVTTVDDGWVRVRVRNDPGVVIASRGRADQVEVGGAGLAGMRERVSAFGGTLRTGPAEDGGWLVEASIPYGQTP